MASLPLRFASAGDFFRFWGDVQSTRSFFLATGETPDIGATVEVELIVGAVRRVLAGEVESVELDEQGRPGIRVGYGEEGANVLVAMRLSVNAPVAPPLDPEPPTDPNAAPAGIPMKTVVDPSRAGQVLVEPPVRIEEARPQPSAPRQPSATTPARSGVRLDEAKPQPSAPRQPSATTPGRAGVRIEEAKPQPSAPRQPSATTPARSGVRIDEAKPQPSAPRQPSATTPGRLGVRIDAAPVAPATAASIGVAQPVRIDAAPASAPRVPRVDEARAQPVAPQQPSSVTPGRVRLDEARPQPVAPQQPSSVTPGRVRIDEARPQPLTPRQPSAVTPGRAGAELDPPPAPFTSSSSGFMRDPTLRGPVGPLITAPPPQPMAPAPPPPAPMAMPSLSTLRPPGSTGATPAFVPSAPRGSTGLAPALAPPAASDGRVGRLGEMLSKLGFPLSPDRVARSERARALLPQTMPIAWLLGVEWIRATEAASLGTIVTLTVDVCATFGGAIDVISPTGATFVFFGLGSQGACVLAAQELRERIEALADGRPDAPSLKLAVVGTRLRADPESAVEGDGVNALVPLLRRAQPGQCLLARNLANGVSDLVGTTPVSEDVQLTSRKPPPLKALPSIGIDPLCKLFELRVTALERGTVAPILIAGPRRSGRTHLAQEFARRAFGQKALVGFTSSLKGDQAPLSSLTELVCQLCQVPFEERHVALGPAMESLGVAPIRREAILAALQLTPTPAPFSTRQVADALRLVVAELAQRRPRVLVFDGLDQADPATIDVVKDLLRTTAPRELLVCLTSPEQLAELPGEPGPALPSFGPAEVDALLEAGLGVSPPELRDLLLQRSGGRPGVVVDLLLLTLARGAVRPKGESLALEGTVPEVALEALVKDRLWAEGARVGRLLEAVWLLGDAAEPASVAQVLPGIAQELWPRAVASRLLGGSGGKAAVSGAFERVVASTAVSGPGLPSRVAALVQGLPTLSLAMSARLAWLLERAGDVQRAGAVFQKVAEAAVAGRHLELSARAQEGMARVLRRHPQRDTGQVLTTRLQLWARVACTRLALGDVSGARRAVNEGLDAKPMSAPHDPELSYALTRVCEVEGKTEEGAEALAEALLASKNAPVRGAVLAALAQACEAKNDLARAQDAWHQALAAAEGFLPFAPWFGEVDFRGRVESRIGALFIAQQQGSRARTWLVSASERFKAAKAPLHAARVMANLGTLSMQLSSFQDAAQWFGLAASTAESGGDFLFQAKQLTALAKVLSRQSDPRTREVATAALGLAEALGWTEGATTLRGLV